MESTPIGYHGENFPAQTKRVLVVEDDPSIGQLIRKVIKVMDPSVEVSLFSNAEDAIFHIWENDWMTGHRPYDLIIADVFLEGQAHGTEICELCEYLPKRIPTIVISGKVNSEDISRLKNLRERPIFMEKPLNLNNLLQVIQSQLTAVA